MYLILDVETTGLPQFNLPLGHPCQPRVAQLACLFLDSNFVERGSFVSLVKPDGWEVSDGAAAVTGITTKLCDSYGIDIMEGLSVLEKFYEKSQIVIAHNLKFDSFLIDVELEIMRESGLFDWEKKGYCTMLKSTPICKIQKNGTVGSYKWPKLVEAYNHFYGTTFDKAHDAMVDVRACAKVFQKLTGVELV